MKISLRTLLIATALLLSGLRAGQAEEISLSPHFDPFAQPASNSTLDAGNVSLVNFAGCGEAACGEAACESCAPQQRHVGGDFFVCQDRGCGWYAQLDFLMLRPYAGGDFLTADGSAAQTAQLGFEPAYRLTFGRQNSDGLGARVRYFNYDRSDTFGGGLLSIEAQYWDAELTQAVNFRRSSLMFAGGLRYAHFAGDAGTVAASQGFSFNGIGLTFAAQAARDLNKSGSFRMVADARWSAVFGNSAYRDDVGGSFKQNDDLVNIFEINIGPQYRRQLRNGAYLTLSGGLEAQYWANVANAIENGAIFDGAGDVGLAGFTSSIAITR